ncbi:PREDICTED: protein LONGIFOLIA 2-like isoform X1 [Camelina sativa]|uniref:Protein LONGIFOLIA 2-like isoform X1 n=1 Tax=Camelina sativa TaxID=90675 RepID=A0ABM1R1E5_CAMSA|nr:PREDICTED: protein LONGIFOLIA 2-like isoform X1 [Camelina sativa]
MSAKLLYNLSDENPNLNKQFGCMNGIFQVFYRQHCPARPVDVSGHVEKSLPPGERKDVVGETNMESDKETERSSTKKKKSAAKEKHRASSESSSRPSFSSSPRSSSFSSAEVSTTASQFDPPGENLIREQPNGGLMMPYDLKELVKGSINREIRTRGEEAAFTHQQQPNSARTSLLLSSLRSPCRSSNEWNEGRGMAVRFKESHRLSYDEREMRNNGYKTGSKFKETPRLSLDSRSNSFRSPRADSPRSSCPEEPETISHRRSNSSVVAKLMGLEVMADNSDTEQRRENRFCDSPRPMSRMEPTALQRSRSVDSMKKIPASAASKFPMEPAPWKQMKAGDTALTVYGEIQKRLTQLEFKKSGKDLRALKQILEAMEKTQQLIDESRDENSTLSTTTPMQRTNQPVPAATSPARNFKSSIVLMKSAAPASPSSLSQNVSLPNVKVGNSKQTRKVTSGKQNAMDLTPRPGLYKGQHDSTKSNSPKTLRSRQVLAADSCSMTKSGRSQQNSVSPRAQPKKLGFEKQSRPTTPKSESGKKQIGRQQTEVASPRRKQGLKPRNTLQQPDDHLSDASSDLRSLRSDSNISLGSNVDTEVTSRHRLERNCDFQEQHTPRQRSSDFGIKQDRPSLKPLKVTIEQPSPVSVLDAAFDDEDSPSPVRKISLSFKEEDPSRSEESEWINKPTSFCRSILFPESNQGTTQLGSDLLEYLPEDGTDFKSGDNKYILEILLASGLLRDLEYSMVSFQLHQARLPINPGLFFILEQNKASNVTLPDSKYRGRGFRHEQTNATEKIRRKLVFDTVNEILAQRFTAEGSTKPRLTSYPLKKMEKISKEEKLLQTLCSEIDRLQQNNSKCLLEDDEEDIVWEDQQIQGMNLKEFEGETPGIVLDIERMIFRDLVNEVCFC